MRSDRFKTLTEIERQALLEKMAEGIDYMDLPDPVSNPVPETVRPAHAEEPAPQPAPAAEPIQAVQAAPVAESPAVEIPAPEPVEKSRRGRRKKAGKADDPKAELLRLSKRELLEIMVAQGEEIDRLRAEVSDLAAKLDEREFHLSKLGSIAEASLAVTDIFKEAEKAAMIYLENARRMIDEKTNRK